MSEQAKIRRFPSVLALLPGFSTERKMAQFTNAAGAESELDTQRQKAEDMRHDRLSIAVPFPDSLNWSDAERAENSLNTLRMFGEELALSVIDWYLDRKRGKKIQSISLRYASYSFAIIGVAVPLVKIFNPRSLEHLLGPAASDISDIAVEAALVLLAIAGGLHAIDRLIGASSAWMRYMTATVDLSAKLLEFRFAWNDLERRDRQSTAGTGSTELAEAAPASPKDQDIGSPQQDQEAAKFELVRCFCTGVVDLVRQETGIWATEVAKAVDTFEKHLESAPFHRPPGRT